MSNPFKEVCFSYLKNGYSVLPLLPNKKHLTMSNWQRFCTERPTRTDLDLWSKSEHNIGLACGIASNCIAIDLDYDIDGMHAKIKEILPETPLAKVGAKGVTYLYRYSGEKNKKWSIGGQQVIELLSTGNQTVVPPSIHPDTQKPYYWCNKSMAEVSSFEIPTLPKDFVEQINKLFGVEKPVIKTLPTTYYEKKTDDKDIEKAIDFISCESYETWVQIGMALNDHYQGGGQGFQIWDAWSSKGTTYKGSEDTGKKWRSFNGSSDNIKIATLFKYASDNGYKPETIECDQVALDDMKLDMEKLFKKEKKDSLGFEILNAPGLVGEICEYINDTALYKQPMLALSAAITAAGTIYGHRVKSSTDLRTNFYCIAVAETGSGKNHPRMAVIDLFKKCGIDSMIGGDPASDAGLLASIKKGEGVRLLQIDEFGHYLKSIKNPNGGKHLASIMSNFTKLFTSANTTFYGQEYSERTSKLPRQDIEQPCLNVLGSTTPDRLNESLSSDDVLDGFLTRFLIVISTIYAPDRNEKRFNLSDYRNSGLFDRIKQINTLPTNGNPNASLGQKLLTVNPFSVPETKSAKEISDKFYKSIQKRRIEAIKANDPFKGVYTRCFEQYAKLCLIANEDMVITETSAIWARNMIEYNLAQIKNLVSNQIFDSSHEKNAIDVLNIIKAENGMIASSELYNRTRKLRPRDRTDAIDYLIKAEKIEQVTLKSDEKKGRKPTYYKLKGKK